MWETPLSFAATYGYYEIVAFLCANNADVNVASSRERHTPLHEAVLAYLCAPTEKSVYIQIANILCKWGATITLEDDRGMTPLNYAYQAHERRMRRAQTIINALIEAIESAQDNTTEVVPSDLTIETRNIVVLSGRSRVPNPHNNNNDDSVIDEDDEIARNLASGMRSFLQ
jgi:hypothetical protein